MFVIISQIQAEPPTPGIFAMIFPMLFLGTIIGSLLAFMAPRKGRNPFLWFLIGLIPFVGPCAALVLASRPDASLLARLRQLEAALAKIDPTLPPPTPTD